ncbi:unnamed protein product [Hymenolepis diminuta]|uniref:Uncharacterized protein n=1 Tax=Hymenolepis diminuta TaxID=6216 RepID=A0A564XVG9_HYMDI|nr:unnamed protein product [Hymenolepis diminuta]
MKHLPVNMATYFATYANGRNLDELAESTEKIQDLGILACVHAMLLHNSLMSWLNCWRSWNCSIETSSHNLATHNILNIEIKSFMIIGCMGLG